MKTVSYYSFQDSSPSSLNCCSQASAEAPLIVNCAGNFHSEYPFITDNSYGREDYYLLHVTSGELQVRMPDGTKILSAGDSVIFPPKYKYYYSYTAKGEPLSYLWVHFTGSSADFYLEETGFLHLPAVFPSSDDPRAQINFKAMFDIFANDDTLRTHSLAASLLQILVCLSPFHSGKNQRKTLTRSLRYINSAYTEDIRIPDLAAMENLSNSRYHTVFKATVGVSPRAYITGLRMRHACELLRTTDMPVKQIGALVGYRDPHFFSKTFKSALGVSPAEYRKG